MFYLYTIETNSDQMVASNEKVYGIFTEQTNINLHSFKLSKKYFSS